MGAAAVKRPLSIPALTGIFFTLSLTADLKLPRLFGLTTAAELMGITFDELLDLIRAGEVRAFHCSNGLTQVAEPDIREYLARATALETSVFLPPIEEPHVDVGLDLRKSPRYRFPAAAKPREVLNVYRRLLGKKMPRGLKVPRGSNPTEVVEILKKALKAREARKAAR